MLASPSEVEFPNSRKNQHVRLYASPGTLQSDEPQIFMDKLSGAKSDRPGLSKCLDALQSDDILVVWRLDRLGRSMRHLITLVEDLRARGVGFRSLNEGAIDTTSASGELIFNIFSALAQFERRLIQERTKAGLAAARARGRRGGRPPLDADQAKVLATRKLHGDTSITITDICKTLNISRSTYYRYLGLAADDSSEGNA